MTPPRFHQEDVGSFYADEKGDLWKLIAYCAVPTATLERVTGDPEQVRHDPGRDRIEGAVMAQAFEGFRKMVTET